MMSHKNIHQSVLHDTWDPFYRLTFIAVIITGLQHFGRLAIAS